MKSPSEQTKKTSQVPAARTSASGQKKPAPLLSICIPTYNRARYVEAQARSVIDNILSRHDNVELVIINNVSKDDTAERLAGLSHPNFRLINRDVHYDTAEENMMRSLEFATGDYVWFLGDDDPVHLTSVDLMISRIARHDFALLVFNSTTIRPQGHVADLQPMPMNGPMVSASLDRIVESIGLINTFAGISNVVQLRRNLDAERGLQWLRTSKIYSHVAWFVEAQKGQQAAFINAPLVFYRLNDYSDGHWDRAAKKFDVPSLYFWSLGVVRLLARLVELGCLAPSQVGQLFELTEGGYRYRLIDDIVFKTHSQLLRGAQSNDPREQLSAEDVEEIRTFCLRCDPTLFDGLEIIRKGREALSSGWKRTIETEAARFARRFMESHNDRQKAGQFVGRFAGRIQGFDLYSLPLCFVAIHHKRTDLRDATLRMIDPVSDGRNVFVADTYDALVDILTKHQAALSAATPTGEGGSGTVIVQEPNLEPLIAELDKARSDIDRLHVKYMDSTAQLGQAISGLQHSLLWRMVQPIRRLGERIRSFGAFKSQKQILRQHFDEGWYLRRYPHVALSAKGGLVHFIEHGVAENCNPNAYFDRNYYLATYPDIAAAKIDPFQHFIDYGLGEGRRPHPKFTAEDYKALVLNKR